MKDLANSLLPILLIMLGIAITTTFVFIRSPARLLAKFLMVPCALAAAASIPVIFIALMGYAVPVPPPEQGLVIAHRTVVVGSKKKTIELWLGRDGSTRLYSMPYSQQLEKVLDEAAQGKQNGLEGQLSFKKRGNAKKNNHDDSEGDYEFDLKLLRPEDILPKHELDAPERLELPPTPGHPEKPKQWT
jgi:hypothetical protein